MSSNAARQREFRRRAATRALVQALQSAQEFVTASDRGIGLDAFTSRGVSANFCEAVASIIDHAEGADGYLGQNATNAEGAGSGCLSTSRFEVLREAARELRLREPRRDETILGYVTHLHRDEDGSERRQRRAGP